MTDRITQIMEAAPTAFVHLSSMERPAFIAAGAAVAVAGVVAERFQSFREKADSNLGVPVADPEIAQREQVDGRPTRRWGIIGYYAAVGAASFALADHAEPYSSHSEARGRVTPVVLASYAGDAADMRTSTGKAQSRLDASIEGVLNSAEDNKVPYSLILDSKTARLVDSMPSRHKDLKRTRERVNEALADPEFRNARAHLADGVEQAVSLGAADPNKIVIIAPGLEAGDIQDIKALNKRLKAVYPEDSVSAVAVGQGEAEYRVADDVQTSSTDVESFTKAVGESNVRTARSADEIRKAVDAVAKQVKVTEKKQDNNIFQHIAEGMAGLMGLVLVRNRLGGLLKGRK